MWYGRTATHNSSRLGRVHYLVVVPTVIASHSIRLFPRFYMYGFFGLLKKCLVFCNIWILGSKRVSSAVCSFWPTKCSTMLPHIISTSIFPLRMYPQREWILPLYIDNGETLPRHGIRHRHHSFVRPFIIGDVFRCSKSDTR